MHAVVIGTSDWTKRAHSLPPSTLRSEDIGFCVYLFGWYVRRKFFKERLTKSSATYRVQLELQMTLSSTASTGTLATMMRTFMLFFNVPVRLIFDLTCINVNSGVPTLPPLAILLVLKAFGLIHGESTPYCSWTHHPALQTCRYSMEWFSFWAAMFPTWQWQQLTSRDWPRRQAHLFGVQGTSLL